MRKNNRTHALTLDKTDTHNLKRRVLCKQHASVNPGACPACVLAEYYDKQLAAKDEMITMLQGTVDRLTNKNDC